MVKSYEVPSMGYYPYFAELLESNHILIGGKTGSGKSVLLNDFLYTLLAHSPVKSQFLLIDPKRVELCWYRDLEHCLGYANTTDGAVDLLNKAIGIIESRYKQMEKKHLRLWDGGSVYVVIDELADLMTTSKKVVLPLLQRIAQVGRASKVFLVACTQSPSRLTIPAALTLNFTCRMALQCFSAIESRQIIGENGAELLPRYGQCLVRDNDGLKKISVPLTNDSKLTERINFWVNYHGKKGWFRW